MNAKKFSPEEELLLVKQSQKGDEKAFDKLAVAYRGYIRYVALSLTCGNVWFMELCDLEQEGLIGFYESVRHFDESKSGNFPAYAGSRIRNAIIDALRKSSLVSIPHILFAQRREMNRCVNYFAHQNGRLPTKRELRESLPADLQDILEELCIFNEFAIVLDDESLFDRILVETRAPEEIALQHEEQARFLMAVQCALAGLSPRELEIVRHWSGFADKKESIEKVGKKFGIGGPRASQVLKEALEHIRTAVKRYFHGEECDINPHELAIL